MCARTGLPLAWEVATAKRAEFSYALPLVDVMGERGFGVGTCALDKGYDQKVMYRELERRGIHPVIPLRATPDAQGEHRPCCEHGALAFAGADFKRKATKLRCPTGECNPKSVWSKPTA